MAQRSVVTLAVASRIDGLVRQCSVSLAEISLGCLVSEEFENDHTCRCLAFRRKVLA